jgi:hypothetical protein
MSLKNLKITSKGLYWGLIVTFAILYICVGFVSTLHSITFFQLANNLGLAILLGLTYEVGQASVLFSILMTKGKEKFLPWALMFLLTALQTTANVYASFKFMATSGSTDWTFWQKSILFGVQASSPEMYQVIISWIAGALLPIVALGMTALVATNMKMMSDEDEEEKPKDTVQNETESEEDEFGPIDLSKEEPDKLTDYQKKIIKIADEYKDEVNPRTEIREIIDDGGISNEHIEELDDMDKEVERLSPEWREVNGKMHPDHEKFVKEQSEINEKLISNPENPIGKYDMEFGPEFTKEMEQIRNEIAAEEVLEPPKKKRGRPPKQKDKVVETKKAQEPLQKEEVKVLQKPKRRVNPLKRKPKKIKPLKNLKEINKPSKGEEVIALLEKMDKDKEKEPIIPEIDVLKNSQEILVPPELKENYESIIVDGVEVIDAKAVPKPSKVKKNLT